MKTIDLPRERLFLKKADVARLLGQGILKDCLKAGWLAPCTTKQSSKRPHGGSVYFRSSDVAEVEMRLNRGEYPEPAELQAQAQ